MAALRGDNTFLIKIRDDFENQLRRSRQSIAAGLSSVSSKIDGGGGVIRDNLSKRLIFDETLVAAATDLTHSIDQGKPNEAARKRSADGELVSSKAQLIKLQNALDSLQTESKRNQMDFDRRLEEMNARLWREKEVSEEKQMKLQQILDRYEQVRNEFSECRLALKTQTNESRNRIAALEKERDDLQNELNEHNTKSDEIISTLKSDFHNERTEKDELQNRLEILEEQLQEYSTKSMNVVDQMRIAEEATAELKEALHRIKELEVEVARQSDDTKLTRILQNQLSELPNLERENRALKEENRVHRMRDDNIMLIKEELDASRNALERSERLCADLPKCRLENEDLRKKLNSWENFLSIIDQGQVKTPQNVAKTIARLQQHETILLEKVGALTTINNSLQTAKANAEMKTSETTESMLKLDKAMKRQVDQIRHLQRKLLLVAKERDFYRQLVDNYEKDATIVSSSSSPSSLSLSIRDDDRVQRLESLVDGYKKTVASLETELEVVHQQLAKFGRNSSVEVEEERTRLVQEIKELKSNISACEDRTRQLVEEKAALEIQVEYFNLKGDFNPQKTRVVHLSSNPVTWDRKQRADEQDRLRNENENLRQRLRLLEEAGGKVEDMTFQVGEKLKDIPSTKDIEVMKEQLSSAELKNKRLMEAFRKLSAEFREVAYTLLGYKLELPCNNQFKLSSVYAESENHYLLFEKADSGEFRLLETPYSKDIDEKIEIYLHTYHSIPAFLSNLTLELFNSQTALPSSSSMDFTNL